MILGLRDRKSPIGQLYLFLLISFVLGLTVNKGASPADMEKISFETVAFGELRVHPEIQEKNNSYILTIYITQPNRKNYVRLYAEDFHINIQDDRGRLLTPFNKTPKAGPLEAVGSAGLTSSLTFTFRREVEGDQIKALEILYKGKSQRALRK